MLLAIEGVTILSVQRLISAHVFIGMLLIPIVALKMGSTIYRFSGTTEVMRRTRAKGLRRWSCGYSVRWSWC